MTDIKRIQIQHESFDMDVECDPFLQLNIARRKKEKIGFLLLFIYIYKCIQGRGKWRLIKITDIKKKIVRWNK